MVAGEADYIICSITLDKEVSWRRRMKWVQEGSDGPNTLLMPHLRLAWICRRRMLRSLAFDHLGCVAVVEEVSW